MTPKVSVLVPIYGVEKYIERCARSLFNQSLRDEMEFIFVNDSTKDKSIDILMNVICEYPTLKEQIKIIHHPFNMGLAVARVTGVKAARGQYVAHCDSDDWVEPDMYEIMYKASQSMNADIVVCDYFSENSSGSVVINQALESSRERITSSLLRFEQMHPFLWIRLIKRSFYKENNFYADPKITFCEDLAVTIPMHLSTDNVVLVSRPLYHYNRINMGSMTNDKTLKQVESCKLTMDILEQYIRKHRYDSVIPALNYRRFKYYLPLITCLETYNPKLWLELDNRNVHINLMPRSGLSVWLVRHHFLKLNKFLQVVVRKLFNR